MKKLIAGIMIGLTVGVVATSNVVTKVWDETKQIVAQVKNPIKVSSEVIDGARTVTEYSDESWSVRDTEKEVYAFQPAELLDWDLEVSDEKELENVIKTYKELKPKVEAEDKKVFVTSIDYVTGKGMYTYYNDGSWSLEHPKSNTYIFQPVELGDWNYTLENKEQLENIISIYSQIKNTGECFL